MANWQSLARAAAQQEGVDPNLFVALVQQESSGNANARSGAGAIGYTQLLPGTAKSLGVDPYNPQQNLRGGAKYLAEQLKTFHGDVPKALAAYNAGPGAVQKYGGVPPYAETQAYVKTILGNAGHVSGSVGSPSTQAAGTGSAVSGQTASVDPGQQGSAVALLTALAQQRQPAPIASAGLQAPSFAAGPKLAGGAAQLASSAPAAKPDISQLLAVAQAAAGSGGGVTQGQAPDAAQTGSSAATQAPASSGGSGPEGSKVLELIHNDGSGPGYGIKNGQVVNGSQVFSAVWAGHKDHVHVAAGPKTVVALGKYAQSLGLHVGQNPHFGGVDPVHVPGSYHYKGEAIDVSGTPKQMDQYARAVEQYNRTRRLPQS